MMTISSGKKAYSFPIKRNSGHYREEDYSSLDILVKIISRGRFINTLVCLVGQ